MPQAFAQRVVMAICVGLGLWLAAPAHADRVTVFAAASLKTALDAVADQYAADTGTQVTVSFAGSSTLARQIERGAPADVFLSANPDWMDHLEAAGRIIPGTRRDLWSNRLVLIGHGPDPKTQTGPKALTALPDLLGPRRLAMALVDAVPAGIYGKAALTSLNLWDAVAPQVAQADNVRAALALVARGEAPFGIVYATDALAEPSVHVVARFPSDTHPDIVYPGAALRGNNTDDATAFLDHLATPRALDVLRSHGFAPVGD